MPTHGTLCVFFCARARSDFRAKGVWVTIKSTLDCFLSHRGVLYVVAAVRTVASLTVKARGKTFAIPGKQTLKRRKTKIYRERRRVFAPAV